MKSRLTLIGLAAVIIAASATWFLLPRPSIPHPASLFPHYRFGDIIVAPVPMQPDDNQALKQMMNMYVWKFVLEQTNPNKGVFIQLVTHNSAGKIMPIGGGPFALPPQHLGPQFVYVFYLPEGSNTGVTACLLARTAIQLGGMGLRDYPIKNPAYGAKTYNVGPHIATYSDALAVFRAGFSNRVRTDGVPWAPYTDICLRASDSEITPPPGPEGRDWLPYPKHDSDP